MKSRLTDASALVREQFLFQKTVLIGLKRFVDSGDFDFLAKISSKFLSARHVYQCGRVAGFADRFFLTILFMSSAKIMVVDDSVTTRLSLKRTLTTAGFEVGEADNGLRALELLDDTFDLMVLDVNMPELDGYGVCERIRERGVQYANFPILFLTSLETHAMELLGNEFGAYLKKPYDPTVLLDKVEELLASKSTSSN